MTLARYNGHATALYPDYVDIAAGHTLTAEPGHAYDVRPASGRNPGLPPFPGDGKWAAWTLPAPASEATRPPWAVDVELPPLPQTAPETGEPPTEPAAPEGEPAPESEG